MKTKKLVIFDFDGVLVDSFDFCLEINQANFPNMTSEKYKTWFLGNFYDAVDKEIEEGDFDENQRQYWERFMKGIDQIVAFEKTKEMLERLKGFTLVVVSSSREDAIEKMMKNEDILNFFDKIYGCATHRSKIEKFKMILRDYNVDREDCIFVTDTLGDLREAEKVGIESIAVGWGFHDEQILKQGNPKIIVHKSDELVGEIEKHFARSYEKFGN